MLTAGGGLEWLRRGRLQLPLRAVGAESGPREDKVLPRIIVDLPELDVEGVGIIVSDAAVQYKSEASHGEVLVFAIAFSDFNKYGCDIVWRAADKASGREVARGKTGIVFFDYSRKRMAPVPPPFRNRAEAAGAV